MKEILLLCRERTLDVNGLSAELERRGRRVRVATPPDLLVRMEEGQNRFYFQTEKDPLEVSCVFGWVSLHQREYGMWLLRAFALAGIPVLNGADVLEIGQNKFLNSVLLQQAGIPHIPTALVGSLEQAESVAADIGFPLVVKPVVGAKGEQVARVDDLNALRNLAPFYMQGGHPFYLQACVSKPDRDIRVRVIGYQADYAFYRYLDKHGFLTNLSTGGTWAECPLTPELTALAERCARVFQAPVAGVDIVEDESTGEYRVIEVNITPAITWPREETVPLVATLIENMLDPNKTQAN